MDFHPDVLTLGAVMEVPLTFYPREARRYDEKLSFILNSCVTKHVEILGQGIEMKVRNLLYQTLMSKLPQFRLPMLTEPPFKHLFFYIMQSTSTTVYNLLKPDALNLIVLVCIVWFQLELEDPKQRKVKLGSLMLGQKVKKQVVVVNRSPLDLSFTLVLNTNSPLDTKVCNTCIK